MALDLRKIGQPKSQHLLFKQFPMVDRSIFTPIRTPQINLLGQRQKPTITGVIQENIMPRVEKFSELAQLAGQKAIDFAKQCRADYLEIKEYERIGRVMNPYRQSNPSSFRAMRFAYDVSEYAVFLAGEAKVYAEEFINSHPKLKAGLDEAAAKTKETSQKIYEFVEPKVLKAKDYAFQYLSDYLEAKEKMESIDEYESGPMAFGINYLSVLDGTSNSSEKVRKSAYKLLLDRAKSSKDGRRFLDGLTDISKDDTELIDTILELKDRRYRTDVLKRASPFFSEAIDLSYRVREGTIKRSLIPEEEFGNISGIFENTRRKNLRLNGNFLERSMSNSSDKSMKLDDHRAAIIAQLFGVAPIRDTYDAGMEFDDQRISAIALLNVESGTKHLLKDNLDIVYTLRTHSSWFVRATLAGNPYISEETANKLMEDENPIVRRLAAQRFISYTTRQIQTSLPA